MAYRFRQLAKCLIRFSNSGSLEALRWANVVQLARKSDFPFRIKQDTEEWCIPATIEAVTKYSVGRDVPQRWIWERWDAACKVLGIKPNTIWFGAIKKLVLDCEKEFSWTEAKAETSLPDFDAVCATIRDSLTRDVPPIISTPVIQNRKHTGFWHMLCVVAYDNNSLEMHDPDPNMPPNSRWYATAQLEFDLALAKSKATHLLLLNRRT